MVFFVKKKVGTMLTPASNKQMKEWRKLTRKKYRHQFNRYLIEGDHLVEEAIRSGLAIHELIATEEALERYEATLQGRDVYIISKQVAEDISDTVSNQGIFATINMPDLQIELADMTQVLVLDAVQDPGNVGTLIRTADAAGFQAVILGQGTVDLYNSKVLRSAQGSHFHMPIIEADLQQWIPQAQAVGFDVFGSCLDERAKPFKEATSPSKFALIVGNEGNGISADVLAQTDHNLYIPMQGQAESLNVAIAGSILMFHLAL